MAAGTGGGGCCGGGARRCCAAARLLLLDGGEVAIPVLCALVEDKGKVGHVLDKGWRGGEATGDDHGVAALSGLCHADIGIVQSVPKTASMRLSSLGALKQKLFRH